jgi:hypothetical protein
LVQGFRNADKIELGYSYARMITVPHATYSGHWCKAIEMKTKLN